MKFVKICVPKFTRKDESVFGTLEIYAVNKTATKIVWSTMCGDGELMWVLAKINGDIVRKFKGRYDEFKRKFLKIIEE